MTSRLSIWISGHRRRTALIVAASLVALTAVAATVWAIRLADRAESLAAELKVTAGSAESAIAVADRDTISDLSSSLSTSRTDAQDLYSDLWPLRWTGAVLGWVPYLGDNLTAVPDLTARLNDDLDAAIALVNASELLVLAYEDVQATDTGLLDTLNSLPGELEIQEISDLMEVADVALGRAEDKADKTRDHRLIGRVGAESSELRDREARLREVIDWVGLVTESLSGLAGVGRSAIPVASLFERDDARADSFSKQTLSAMPELETAVGEALLAVSSANSKMPEGVRESTIGMTLTEFEPVLRALGLITSAGSMTWSAVSPALDTMRSSPGGLIGEGSTVTLALEQLEDRRQEFIDASDLLVSGIEILSEVSPETPVVGGPAKALEKAAEDLSQAADFLADFPAIGPKALGVEGPRRYLVLGQTSDELRGSGGFVSGVWEMIFDDGQLVEFTYHDVVDVDDRSKIEEYPLPPELLATHMDAPVWLMRDSTWAPDFPSAARSAASIFTIGQGERPIDGVIALTQWAIVSMSQALGDIQTDNGVVHADEVIPTLEKGSDVEGRAFVDNVFRGVVAGLAAREINERLFPLAIATQEVLERKDTMVFMSEPDLQEVVSGAGWSGALGGPAGDRLAIIDSNVGWNKVDRNIARSMVYEVDLSLTGPMNASLEVGYENLSSPGDRGCDIQAPVNDSSYAELKNGCYWNVLRVYVHRETSLERNTPLDIPAGSVIARSGSGLPGEDSVAIGVDPAGKYISGLITVPAGERTTVEFDFVLPPGVVENHGEGIRYVLALTSQAGVLARETTVRLNLPPGFEYAGSSLKPAAVSDGMVEFNFSLDSDTTVELDLVPRVSANVMPRDRQVGVVVA